MKTEYRDALIGGGVLVILVLAYLYVVEPWLANQQQQTAADEQNANALVSALTPSSTSAQTTPAYNMPSTLVLPPFNTGNAPTGSPGGPPAIPPDSSSGNAANTESNCGCNACNVGNGSGGNSYLATFLSWMKGLQIQSPANTVPPGGFDALPTPATISPPQLNMPFANTYDVWAAKEGFEAPNPNINQNNVQEDSIPGSQGWNGQQIYAMYTALRGGLFKNASPADQQAALQKVWAMG
jgi:hypothetical protein